jgi:hypothetical protein
MDAARVKFLPMASTATPVSAATEQEHYHNDNQDQFHENSPLMAMALFAAYQSIQQRLQSIVPDKRAPPQFAFRGVNSDRSVGIRKVPSWQIRPNGVMSLLSASWRSPDRMGRA